MSITLLIIILTVVISFMGFNNRETQGKLMLNPYLVAKGKQYYRLWAHGLVHADYFHLFVNMYVLYSFGSYVEHFFAGHWAGAGKTLFILFYMAALLFTSIPAMRKHHDNMHYNAVGASGAVSAVLYASILFSPVSEIYLMFIPIGIPAFLFGAIYLAYEHYLEKRGGTHIAHDAHIYGAIFGFGAPLLLEPGLLVDFVRTIRLYIF